MSTTAHSPTPTASKSRESAPPIEVSVADFTATPDLEARLAKREERAPWRPGPGRVELFRYRDLLIRIAQGAGVRRRATEEPAASRLGGRLVRPEPFYIWRPEVAPAPEVFSAIVVNRMEPRHRDRVAELFAALDATDFPATMGTRLRLLYSLEPDVYLHVQEFARVDGLTVIDEAWRDSDPRFLKICEDLTPLVPPYDERCVAHEDHLAQRFYVRSTA